MKTLLLVRRYLGEYVRRPINLILLVVVPVIFVMLTAGALADFASIVGGIEDTSLLAAPTAGWAAAFLSGVAGFFHVLGSRDADHRLAHAGMGPLRIVVGRMVSGLVLAFLAAGASLLALQLRTGIGDPVRAIFGTAAFALIYLGLGAAIGAVVRSEVNGSLAVIFVWMLDVFLGPAMAGGDAVVARVFPSHFVTLVMLDSASGHSGPIGDLGWALIWVVAALLLAVAIFTTGAPTRDRTETRHRRGSSARTRAAFRYGMRDYRRNLAMWVLLVALPIFFITLSFAVTPDQPTPVELTEGGSTSMQIVSMVDVHGAIMVPITVAFLAGLAGLFVLQGSLEADGRLAIAGYKTREILGARLGVVWIAALLTTAVSIGVTAADFAPGSWSWFITGNALVGMTYGLVGVLVGSVVGRLGGLYVMFLLPFVDVGLAQNIMFSAAPPDWGSFLPGRGAVQVLVDGAFTSGFDQARALMLAVGWLVLLALLASVVFRRVASPARA